MNYIEFLYQAVNSEHGVCIETSHPASVKQQLYQARKSAVDPALAKLKIVLSPVNPNHIWILKTKDSQAHNLSIMELDLDV